MAEPLSAEDVQKVARLARLKLSEADVAKFSRQLGDILGYIQQLNAVPTDGVEPMAHAVPVQNVLREDVEQPSLPRAEALQNAPRADGKFFLVPQILDYA
jgi:aspartyl-tRNA(Asn)/glutamyl-tRNA(Gln) amidotransferase subunit C